MAKAGCTFVKDMTDMMDRFTLGDIMSTEQIQIIIYQLDLTAGAGGLDDSPSSDEEGHEFTQCTQPMVSSIFPKSFLS